MGTTWDLITALSALTGVIGGLIMVWWKVRTENAAIRKEVADHNDKIIMLITTKANATDLLKLTEVVAKLEAELIAHHQNSKVHRTEDFEKRLDSLILSVNNYQTENRLDHQRLTDLISRKIAT